MQKHRNVAVLLNCLEDPARVCPGGRVAACSAPARHNVRRVACSASLLLTPSLVESRIGRGCNDIGLDVIPCEQVAIENDDVGAVHVQCVHDTLQLAHLAQSSFAQMACRRSFGTEHSRWVVAGIAARAGMNLQS